MSLKVPLLAIAMASDITTGSAFFDTRETVTLTITPGVGGRTYVNGMELTPTGQAQKFTFDKNEAVTLAAEGTGGYVFDGWSDITSGIGKTLSPRIVSLNADLAVGTSFTADPLENNVVLASISITTMPLKTTYTAGETLDLSGLVITAAYSDGTSAPVSGYTTATPDGTVLRNVEIGRAHV